MNLFFWRKPEPPARTVIGFSSLSEPPDTEELKHWKSMPAGKYFYALLNAGHEEIKEDLVSGLYTGETADATAQLYAKAIGRCEQLRDVIHILEEFGEPDDEG